jgi:predicted nucleic acid-binding protein
LPNLKSSTPERGETLVSDTTAVRYFTLIDRIEILGQLMGGRIRVPREVFDPFENSRVLPEDLLSEIGQTELYWARKRSPDAGTHWSRFKALRHRTDIEVVDLVLGEAAIVAEVTARRFLRRFGKAGRLGKGEAAAIALAERRGWTPIIDDRVARAVLKVRSSGTRCYTTDDMLRRAALAGIMSSQHAENLYQEMRRLNYRGPSRLWEPDPD